jgi:EmrB/QacA subfamily drug resistance transporter
MPHTDTGGNRLDPPLVRLIVVMFVGGLLALLDATIINVGIGALGHQFGASLATVEWVGTGYLLAVAVSIPVTGWAVDQFGGRRVWLLGLGAFVVASTLAGLAWSVGSLIVFRVLQGLGGGMLEPTRLTVLARTAGPRRAGRVIGLVSMSSTIGPVLGPIIGGLILTHLGWRWMFLVNLPVGLVALALAARLVPRDVPDCAAGHRLDLLGVASLCPGFAVLLYALSQAGDAGFDAARVVVALGAGAALFAAYAVHALRTRRVPLVDLRLFSSRGYSASIIVMVLVGAGLFSLMFLLPLYWQQVRGQTVLAAGLLLSPLGLGTLAGMPLAGRLSDRVGARLLVPSGAALITLGTLGHAQAGTTAGPLLLAGCSLLAGLGLGLAAVPTMSSIYRTVPTAAVTSATGAIVIARQLGASLGIAVVALILQARHDPLAGSFETAFWCVLGGGVLVGLAGLALPGRPPVRPDDRQGGRISARD